MPIQTTTRQSIIGLLGAGFLILIANVIFAIWIGERSLRFATLTVTDQQLKAGLSGLLSAAQDAETGQRGYLLTEEESYLEPYVAASQNMPKRLSELESLSAGHEKLREHLPELKALAERRLAIIDESIAKMRAGDRTGAVGIIRDGLGKETMDKLRAVTGVLNHEQDQLIATGLANLEESRQWARLMSIATLLLLLGLAATTVFIVVKALREVEAARGELQALNIGLEETVEARTREVLRANEEIQRFAYIVSHDLRAPLVNIMGFTSELEAVGKMVDQQYETLKTKSPDLLLADTEAAVKVDLPEAISFIRTSTAKMDRLINAILGLSREGQRVLTPVDVNVTAMVGDIARSLKQQIDERDGEIIVGALPPLVTDRLAIEQIFSNLIENAVKYIDRERAPRIEVTGRADGYRVEYAISDNGRGIEEKDLERIFELFRRAGRQDTKGEGLGLAFVRAAVRRLGGTIAVSSKPGEGTAFTLKFPARLHVSQRGQNV